MTTATPAAHPRRITTDARLRSREDRAGDPLDGLVNLFDLGIVLSVAFLLAALSSLHLSQALVNPDKSSQPPITVRQGSHVDELDLQPNGQVIGHGVPAGTVYRLDNGQLVYVQDGGSASASTPSDPGSH